jgi:hypothetical protein
MPGRWPKLQNTSCHYSKKKSKKFEIFFIAFFMSNIDNIMVHDVLVIRDTLLLFINELIRISPCPSFLLFCQEKEITERKKERTNKDYRSNEQRRYNYADEVSTRFE